MKRVNDFLGKVFGVKGNKIEFANNVDEVRAKAQEGQPLFMAEQSKDNPHPDSRKAFNKLLKLLKRSGLAKSVHDAKDMAAFLGEDGMEAFRKVRAFAVWGKNFPKVIQQTSVATLKQHPNYKRGKAGLLRDSDNVVSDIIKPGKIDEILEGNEDAIIVSVMAIEAKGNNKLPFAYAKAIAKQGRNKIGAIYQTNKTKHTDKDAAGRLVARAMFKGRVKKGAKYIIVDDVVTTGGTVRALKEYIESKGGIVVRVASLANASNQATRSHGSILALQPETVKEIQKKFNTKKLNSLLSQYGIAENYKELTNGEARYILTFGGLDSFRTTISNARLLRSSESERTSQRRGISTDRGRRLKNARYLETPHGEILGFVTPDGNVFLDTDNLRADIPIHEFGHLWNSYIKEYHNNLWQKGKELINISPYRKQVLDLIESNPKTYGHMKGNEDAIADEALARAIGDKGAVIFKGRNKNLATQFKAWVQSVWNAIRQKEGIRDLTADEVQNLTLDKFVEMASEDLLSGKEIEVEMRAKAQDITPKMRAKVQEGQPLFMAWEKNFPDVIQQTNGSTLKNHPYYQKAKAGSIQAARAVVRDVVKKEKISEILNGNEDAIIVPVMAKEAKGNNMLPYAYAEAIAKKGGNDIKVIVQTNKTSHTGADAFGRITRTPEFKGKVIKGKKYIIVDDVATSGSTLRALKEYIESKGGKVVEATALANASHAQTGWGGHLALQPETIEKIKAKFSIKALNNLLSQYGIAENYKDLSNGQAKYILSFGVLDTLRDRLDDSRSSQERQRSGDKRVLRAGRRGGNYTKFQQLTDSTTINSNDGTVRYMYNKNGEILGAVDPKTGKIYLNKEKLNPNMIIHETGHMNQNKFETA